MSAEPRSWASVLFEASTSSASSPSTAVVSFCPLEELFGRRCFIAALMSAAHGSSTNIAITNAIRCVSVRIPNGEYGGCAKFGFVNG